MSIRDRRTVLKGLLAGGLAPLLPGCAAPPSRPAAIARGDFSAVVAYLQALITHDMQTQNLTGLSIAVVNEQNLTWTQGFGWADRASGIPASSDTVYRAGSITKLLTVAAALQFAERGQLDLDAPIRHVLPEFRIGSRFGSHLGEAAVTPRLLMAHHAGLPRDLARGMWGNPESGFQAVLDYLASSELAYPPGLIGAYSNLGLSVLGAAVERLARAPFADHLKQALLQPLGMETASISGPLPASPYLSKAYADGREAAEPGLRDIAAGGLNASVRDLSALLMAMFAQGRQGSHSVLQPATVAEMLRPQNEAAALDLDIKTGLGWNLTPLEGRPLDGGGPIASHGGATVHHRSLIAALPRHRIGIVILCNSAEALALEPLARTVLALMLEAKTGIRQADDAPTWQVADLPAPALAAYAGEYVTPAGLVRIGVDGQRLLAQTQGFRVQLIPDREGFLHARKHLLGLFPMPLGDLEELSFKPESIAGRQILTARRGHLRVPFGERITPLMHPAWPEMAGIYRPLIAAGEFPMIGHVTLFEDDKALYLRLSGDQAPADETGRGLLLQTLSNTLGVVSDKLVNCGEVVRIGRIGNEKTLEISGYTFRKVSV